jgi:hypothetical protein
MTAPRPLRNPEVCVNLWAYADEAGYIARVAARSYVLDGDDAAKLAVLHQLAATDFLHAEWMGVSKQFVISNPDGERMEGVAHASMLNDGVTPGVLFGPLFNKLEAAVPKQARTANGGYEAFSLKLPEDPLTVTTVVMEMDDGRLVPMVSNKA